MNQKVRAGLMTLGMISICVTVAVFFQLLGQYVTKEMVPFIVAGLGISACIYMIYNVFLAQIRYEDTLKNMVDKK